MAGSLSAVYLEDDARGPQGVRMSSICSVPLCGQAHQARRLCAKHYWRWRKYGSTDLPARSETAPTAWLTQWGYRVVYLPEHPMANSAGVVYEHRLVMAEHLGRDLLPVENVHHINGDRLDNRLENLELWSKSQPAGQRVVDKTAWAVAFLKIHRPDLLSADALDDSGANGAG